jgi:hypothetical protein
LPDEGKRVEKKGGGGKICENYCFVSDNSSGREGEEKRRRASESDFLISTFK